MAHSWDSNDVRRWLEYEVNISNEYIYSQFHGFGGPELLAMIERDFYSPPLDKMISLCDRKRIYAKLKLLQKENKESMIALGLINRSFSPARNTVGLSFDYCNDRTELESDHPSRPASEDGRALKLKPEVWKAFLSLCYVFFVTWITAVVMVIVHDKVPDMKKYPPLPDLFLDNVPHIPWAFDMCEVTGSVLMAIWMGVLLFHKHRFILLRRFFALSGTVFLLRCITMLITSLSVPGGHLNCAPREYPSDIEPFSNWSRRFNQAYIIWIGAGMSVRGVRTCGDYMFSGHTVTLTLLNFFITEYTSRRLYLLHIVTWLMNMFGIFFILAAHEHYSIDVFIAFYITSRLFLYYHTLSNNQALMQSDSFRTRIWFPLLSFFESEVDGIVPNEYENPLNMLVVLKSTVCQYFYDLNETPFIKFLRNIIYQQTAAAEFSAYRMLNNIKKNINSPHVTDVSKNQNCVDSSDKVIQTSLSRSESSQTHDNYNIDNSNKTCNCFKKKN